MNRKALSSALLLSFCFVILGALYGGYDFYSFSSEDLRTAELSVAELEQKFKEKESELATLKNFAKNIEGIKKELKELNLKLETATEHMPKDFDLSGLLRKFSMLSQNAGLEIKLFKPGEEKSNEQEFYSSMDLEIEMEGAFSQILVFLDQLARLKRIVKVEGVNMNLTEAVPKEKQFGPRKIASVIKVRAYRFKE